MSLRVIYCGGGPSSAIPRYLAHHPGVEFMLAAADIGSKPFGEEMTAFDNAYWASFPEWVSGEWAVSNGYYDKAIEWSHIEEAWQNFCDDPPDLILVAESEFVPCGDKKIFDGVPCAYLPVDLARGVDEALRCAKSMQATHIFHPSPWYEDLFSLAPERHGHFDNSPLGRVKETPNSGMYFPAENVHYLPLCADPFHFYRDDVVREKTLGVVFSGWCGWETLGGDPMPDNWEKDVELGRDVRVGGDPPQRYGSIYGEYAQRALLLWIMHRDPEIPLNIIRSNEGADAMRSAKIVWTCEASWTASQYHDTSRMWRAAACGACIVKNETWMTECNFTLDEEIVLYRLYYHPEHHLFQWFDYEAMKQKIMWLLNNDKEREEIGRAAAERTKREHVPEHRVTTILDALGLEI